MLKVLNFVLNIICIAGMAICAIGMVLYLAAVMAFTTAGDIMRKIDELIRRR